MKSQMREVIDRYGLKLGSTEDGRAWCLKALHPSEQTGDITGIPDHTPATTVCFQYSQLVQIAPPAGIAAGGTWSCEVYTLSDPTSLLSYYTTDGAGHSAATTVWNTAFSAVGVNDATQVFLTQVQAWRCIYYGATLNLDATALTNRGNLVCCQAVAPPVDLGRCLNVAQVTQGRVVYFEGEDTPEYAQAAIMPNAYSGPAREGCYLMEKMPSNHVEWRDASSDLCMDGSGWAIANLAYTVPGVAGVLSTGAYPGLVACEYSVGQWKGDFHLLPTTRSIGSICLQGLDAAANLRITVRCGFEYKVQPGTALAPAQKPGASYDPVAVETYYAISRLMKDGYPASYNDFGKLWEVIKTIGSALGPLISMFPAGPALVAAGRALGQAVDSSRKAKAKRKTPGLPPGQPKRR